MNKGFTLQLRCKCGVKAKSLPIDDDGFVTLPDLHCTKCNQKVLYTQEKAKKEKPAATAKVKK